MTVELAFPASTVGTRRSADSNKFERSATVSKNQHIVPAGDRWGVRGEGNERLTSVHDTQRQAIEAGREIARNQHSELLIHGEDGRIRERDSHGHDPHPPKG